MTIALLPCVVDGFSPTTMFGASSTVSAKNYRVGAVKSVSFCDEVGLPAFSCFSIPRSSRAMIGAGHALLEHRNVPRTDALCTRAARVDRRRVRAARVLLRLHDAQGVCALVVRRHVHRG